MKKAIIGKKVGMTQIFDEAGKVVPVTVIEAGPCVVVQKKTVEKEGYAAVQLGFEDVAEKKLTKPQKGHFEKASVAPKKYLHEFRLDDCAALNVGDVIKADVFAEGDHVDVTGVSKGKGFEGNIKRWNQGRGRKTHGSHSYRVAGSLGACTYPGEVFRTKRLPGHMGSETVTVQNLEVARVDAARNLLLIKGAIPGAKGTMVTVKSTVK